MEKRGPKRKAIDYHEVELIASKLGFSYPGIRARKSRDRELLSPLEKGRSDGIRSLRALQYQAAKRGSVAMLIWLGKQILGQTDKAAIEQTSTFEGSIEHKVARMPEEEVKAVMARIRRNHPAEFPPGMVEDKADRDVANDGLNVGGI